MNKPTRAKPNKTLKQLERVVGQTIRQYRAKLRYFEGDDAGDMANWETADLRLTDVWLAVEILRQLVESGAPEYVIFSQIVLLGQVAANRFSAAENVLDFANRLKRTRTAKYRSVWSEQRRRGFTDSQARYSARRQAAKIIWPEQ
jgi:hypothetical protein